MKQRVRMPSGLDWTQSRAYPSVTVGGISLNLKKREPQGIVEPRDYQSVRERLREALLSFEDPATGAKPIQEVLRREEIYSGPYFHLAPDLFALPGNLWSFSHYSFQDDQLSATTEWPSGDHRQTGILVARGASIAAGDLGTKKLRDVAPTALAFCGLRVEGVEGEPIKEIAGRSADEVAVPARARVDAPGPQLSAEEEEDISRHLRDLGYIE